MTNHRGFDDFLDGLGKSVKSSLLAAVLGLHMQGLAGKQRESHLRPPRVCDWFGEALMSRVALFSADRGFGRAFARALMTFAFGATAGRVVRATRRSEAKPRKFRASGREKGEEGTGYRQDRTETSPNHQRFELVQHKVNDERCFGNTLYLNFTSYVMVDSTGCEHRHQCKGTRLVLH